MLRDELKYLLRNELGGVSFSPREADDLEQRLERLEGFGLLPRGRGRFATPLKPIEIVATILSLASPKPGFSGLVSKTLLSLRPVGGASESFCGNNSLGMALVSLLHDDDAIDRFVSVQVSDSEIFLNCHGRAELSWRKNGSIMKCYYVSPHASSLLTSEGLESYDPHKTHSTVVAETTFQQRLFQKFRKELKREDQEPYKSLIAAKIEAMDEDSEEIKKEMRAEKLGITNSSKYLNIGVETQATWPREEVAVEFEGKKIILMPQTKDNTTSIHIDLHGQRIDSVEAETLFNRFLSLLTWCDDHYAFLTGGWSGNPVPLAVSKRNLGVSTAYVWVFDRKIPASVEARKAIAIYREGRNAEENYLVPYAVLSYYKIVELKYHGRSEAKVWFRDNFDKIRKNPNLVLNFKEFEIARGTEQPQDYLYRACRTAVAHANKPFSTDPDDLKELRRLQLAADILRALARIFIQNELGVSLNQYDGT